MKSSLRRVGFGFLTGMGLVFLVGGCSALRDEKNESAFEYDPPKPYEYVEPEVIEAARYLPVLPSGRFDPLIPERIAVTDLPDYAIGSDPSKYLKNLVRKVKRKGLEFLPCHYYVSPAGFVFGGMDVDYCGYLGDKRIPDAIIVGVLGNFEGPTDFLPAAQEKALVQLLAWLCMEHSITPNAIFPANEVEPSAPPPGLNLMNWFGPTQTLRRRVAETLEKGRILARKEAKKSSRKRQPPDINTLF